jgi:GMP synthase-like glutamine amidotransferase
VPADVAAAKRAVFLRHHLEDDPGFVGGALARRGYAVDVVTVSDDRTAASLDGVSVLGILGSKWSVYDHDAVGGWLDAELALIAEADGRGVAVLGICFGAQALCVALGGAVRAASRIELGWEPLDGNDEEGIPGGPWFQFHGDECLVPGAATVLSRNDVCVQAFRAGPHLGVQFHPEVDAVQFQRWLDAGARAYCEEAGVSPDRLLADVARYEEAASRRTDRLVAEFLRRASN